MWEKQYNFMAYAAEAAPCGWIMHKNTKFVYSWKWFSSLNNLGFREPKYISWINYAQDFSQVCIEHLLSSINSSGLMSIWNGLARHMVTSHTYGYITLEFAFTSSLNLYNLLFIHYIPLGWFRSKRLSQGITVFPE